nr:HEPN domain-containing protein [Bacteroidota bacterium]
MQALLSQLKSQSFFSENLFDTIEIFEKFNVEIRYPDAEVTPTKEEAAEA